MTDDGERAPHCHITVTATLSQPATIVSLAVRVSRGLMSYLYLDQNGDLSSLVG